MNLQKVSHIFTKIVLKPLRTNLFYIVFSLIFCFAANISINAQEKKPSVVAKKLENQKDTITISKSDLKNTKLKTPKDSVKPNKAALESTVKRKAVDYEKIDQKTKIVTLYNKAELYYEDIELKAGIIVLDYAKNEVYAGRIKDEKGNYSQYPKFKQGQNEVEPDSIRFNFKTKKALVWNSRTKQSEMNIIAERSKKENDSVYFMKNAKLTTSENLEDPEYYFLARTAKFVPGKKVVVGLTNMYIANVPTPLGLPFAFFPMTDTARSGVIIPTFQDTNLRGYSLQNGGYYFALSDNYDLTFTGDYFTNGSYALRFQSAYAKRYKFTGDVQLRFENQINGERGFPNYSKTRQYNIQWTHTQDNKNNPTSRFSASVNLGSSQYFAQSLNIVNNNARLNNSLNSSINYQKTFNSVPAVNMTLTATHSQNTQTQAINMTLPTLVANVDRIFPFAPTDGVKKGFIKNINLQYSVNAQNSIVTTDSLFFKPQMFRDMKTGIQHSIPISTNFKIFKHFSATSSVNFNEVWTFKTIEKSFDVNKDKVVTREIPGFDAYRTYDFSAGLGTNIYGTFNNPFGKKSRVRTIRHTIRPNIGYAYSPDFSNYYQKYALNASQTQFATYTRFENGINAGPSNSFASTMNINVFNSFEAKVVDKDSTKTELKKIMLISNLTFSTAYDLGKKVLQPINVTGGTALFNDRLSVNFGATLDPFALDNANNPLTKFNIANGGSLFRMTQANIAMGYSLSSNKEKNDSTKKVDAQNQRNGGRDDDLFGSSRDLSDRRQSNFDDKDKEKDEFAGFYKTKQPWDLTFAYSLTYGNQKRENAIVNNSLMISGSVQLTPKWRLRGNSGYDFVQKGITFTSINFERDLLSWRMDFNWIPIGDNTQWGFFIGVKAGILSDIKWDKRRLPDPVRR